MHRILRGALHPGAVSWAHPGHEHCGQWAQGQILPGYDDFNVTIDGWTAPYALDSWAKSLWTTDTPPARTSWVQEATYPCLTCCTGGQK